MRSLPIQFSETEPPIITPESHDWGDMFEPHLLSAGSRRQRCCPRGTVTRCFELLETAAGLGLGHRQRRSLRRLVPRREGDSTRVWNPVKSLGEVSEISFSQSQTPPSSFEKYVI